MTLIAFLLQLIIVTCLIYLVQRTYRSKKYLRDTNSLQEFVERIEFRTRENNPYLDNLETDVNGDHWIVIINYQRLDTVSKTIDSIKKHEPKVRILLIDNGSDNDNSLFTLQQFQKNKIDKIIYNHHQDVPQWQKCFSMHQAVNLLRTENVASITFIDNDIEVTDPWIDEAINLLKKKDVALVNLIRNENEDSIHPPLRHEPHPSNYVYKQTFNGQFFIVMLPFFKKYNLPPINEGICNASVEDWYYSRIITQDKKLTACQNKGRVLNTPSIRIQKQQQLTKTIKGNK